MNDETIILKGNRKRAILLAFVSALFACLIYFTGKGDTLSFLGIALFGAGFLVCLYSSIPGTVQLRIDHSGIEMKTLLKTMKLSWSDVDEFYIAHTRAGLSRTKMIGIRFSESSTDRQRKYAKS